jgi:hypothetical protein
MIAIAFLLFRRRWWAPQRRHGLAAPHWRIEMVNLQDLLKASLGLSPLKWSTGRGLRLRGL